MNVLKDLSLWTPVHAFSNSTVHKTLNTDACTFQVENVLIQQQDDATTKSTEYCSKLLSDAEKIFDKTQKDGLAIT